MAAVCARWYETDANTSTPDEVDFYGFESDNRLYKAVYNASGINLSTVNYQDVLDDNQVTHSDRVFYERRRAGTRSQVHWWRGAADRDAAAPSSAMPDDTTTPDQTTGYATNDDPNAGPGPSRRGAPLRCVRCANPAAGAVATRRGLRQGRWTMAPVARA